MATRVAPPRRRCVEFFIAGGIFDAHLRSISARTELHAQRNLAPLRLRRQTPARHNPLFDLHEIGRQPRDSPARRGAQSGQGLQRGPRLSTSPFRRSSRCPLCRHDENSVSPQTISQPALGLKDAVRRLSDVAAYFGRDMATLATLLARLSDRVQANDTARREIERLNEIVES